jgi:hypothetical protein
MMALAIFKEFFLEISLFGAIKERIRIRSCNEKIKDPKYKKAEKN